jgi:hypothetical protein
LSKRTEGSGLDAGREPILFIGSSECVKPL